MNKVVHTAPPLQGGQAKSVVEKRRREDQNQTMLIQFVCGLISFFLQKSCVVQHKSGTAARISLVFVGAQKARTYNCLVLSCGKLERFCGGLHDNFPCIFVAKRPISESKLFNGFFKYSK